MVGLWAANNTSKRVKRKAIAHGRELRAISTGDGLPVAIGGVGLYMAPAFFVWAMAQTRRQSIAAFVTTKLLSFWDLARA